MVQGRWGREVLHEGTRPGAHHTFLNVIGDSGQCLPLPALLDKTGLEMVNFISYKINGLIKETSCFLL